MHGRWECFSRGNTLSCMHSWNLLDYRCQLWNPWIEKHIQAIEAIRGMFIYIQNHCNTALKLLGKTARTQIILSPETPWMLYNYADFADNKAFAKNSNGTMGHKIETRKHQRLIAAVCYSVPNKQKPSIIPLKMQQLCLGLGCTTRW